MVSTADLRRQQAQQRQLQRQRQLSVDRQLQQQALRTGKSVSAIKSQKQVEQARKEAEKKQKELQQAQSKAQDIVEKINKADNSKELEKVIKQIEQAPQSQKQFLPKVSDVRQKLKVFEAKEEASLRKNLARDVVLIKLGQKPERSYYGYTKSGTLNQILKLAESKLDKQTIKKLEERAAELERSAYRSAQYEATQKAVGTLGSVGKQQFETYKKLGYQPKEALTLAKESEGLKMSFTPEVAKKVLAGEKLDIPKARFSGDLKDMWKPPQQTDFSQFGTENIGGMGRVDIDTGAKRDLTGAGGLDISGTGGKDFGGTQVLLRGGATLTEKQYEQAESNIQTLKGQTEPFVSLPISSGGYTPITLGTWGSLFKDTPSNIAGMIKGESGFKDLFSTFAGKGKPKSQKELGYWDKYTQEMQFGTGTFGSKMTEGTGLDLTGATFGELQTMREIEAGLPLGTTALPEEVIVQRVAEDKTKKAQSKVSQFTEGLNKQIRAGKITSEEAQTKLKDYVFILEKQTHREYEKEAEKRLSKVSQVRIKNIGKTKGDIIAERGAVITQIGTFALAYTNPVTGTLASGILTGSSTKQFGTAILGEDLSLSKRLGLIGAGSFQAGMGLWGASAVFGGTPRSMLARQSQRLSLKELQAKRFSIGGKELARGTKGSLFKITGTRATPMASQEVDILAPTFQRGKGGLRLTGGKVTVSTRITDVISAPKFLPLKSTEKFVIGARGGLGGRAAIFRKIGVSKVYKGFDLDEFNSILGSGFIKKKGAETFKEFRFLGAGKQEGQAVKVISGQPKTAFLGFKRIKVRGKVGGVGEIKLLQNVDDFVNTILLGGAKKTPLSKTFQEQVSGLSDVFVSKAGKEAGKTFVKTTLKTAAKTTGKRAISGLGSSFAVQSEKQIEKLNEALIGSQKVGAIEKQKPKLKAKAVIKPLTTNVFMDAQTIKLNKALGVSAALTPKLTTKQKQELKTKTTTIPIITPIGGLGFPGLSKPKIPKILPFDTDKRKMLQIKADNEPYYTEVKQIKTGNWIKVSKDPIKGRQKAEDAGQFVVDNTLSRQFRVKKAKQKPQKLGWKVPPNYSNIFSFKFRGYRTKKGKRIPLKDAKIERKSYIGDTAGELSQLSAARFIAQQNRQVKVSKARQKNLNKLFYPQFQVNSKPKVIKARKANINKITGFDKRLNKLTGY